jgi:hypothetical protein
MKRPDDRRFLEHAGWNDIQVVSAPDIKSRLLKQVGEAHRQQHLPQRIEAQRPQEYALHQQAHPGNNQGGPRQGEQPGAGGPDHRQRDVAPEQEERAVREIDDAHHPEYQGEAAREQKQQGTVGNAVERLDHPEVKVQVPPLRRLRYIVADTTSQILRLG